VLHRARARDQLECGVEPLLASLIELVADLRLDVVLAHEDRVAAGSSEIELLAVGDDQLAVVPAGERIRTTPS
jgi:hypothetical protein